MLGQLQGVKNRLSEFARTVVTDPNVAPIHGLRHRFKTVGMEAGIATRVLDAIQGHGSKDGCGGLWRGHHQDHSGCYRTDAESPHVGGSLQRKRMIAASTTTMRTKAQIAGHHSAELLMRPKICKSSRCKGFAKTEFSIFGRIICLSSKNRRRVSQWGVNHESPLSRRKAGVVGITSPFLAFKSCS